MDQHKKERMPGGIFPDNMIYKGKGLERLPGYAETFPKVLISSADLNEHKHAEDTNTLKRRSSLNPPALAQTNGNFPRKLRDKNKQVPLESTRPQLPALEAEGEWIVFSLGL
jgi:hypothetical protein